MLYNFLSINVKYPHNLSMFDKTPSENNFKWTVSHPLLKNRFCHHVQIWFVQKFNIHILSYLLHMKSKTTNASAASKICHYLPVPNLWNGWSLELICFCNCVNTKSPSIFLISTIVHHISMRNFVSNNNAF